MWALVPFKGAEGAKGRLAPALSEAERRELSLAMVRDVLAALAAAPLDGILIVSGAPVARELAREFATEVFEETVRGLTGAVTEASAHVADQGGAGTLIVHGDVPLLTAAEVAMVLDGHEDVTLVPDRHDIGTNCIAATPPNAMTYQFDGTSFAPHQALARAAGITPRVVRLPGLGLDIDTVDALRDFADLASDTRTGRYLRESGLASRLAGPRSAQ